MRLFICLALLTIPLAAQTVTPPPPTRPVSLTWIPSVTPDVTGVNAYRCTVTTNAPCVLMPGVIPLNGITPIPVPMNGYIDTTAVIGNIYVYAVTAVAPPCPTTIVALPIPACGESAYSNTATVAIGPKPAAPAGAPATSVQ